MAIKDLLLNLFTTTTEAQRDLEKTKIKRAGYAFVRSSSGGGSRANFESPEFDLDVVSAAYDTEAYVRQAIDKYVDLIFKAGWGLNGKNEKAVEYIKMRLAIMAESTGVSTDTFLGEITESVVKYSNAFIIKARLKENLNIPGLKVSGIQGKDPIGGYFVLPASTIQIARDKNGNVTGYQQIVAGQNKPLKIKPEDMIHIYWKKPIGYAFGVPFILSVLDDIRLLREIEDNVSNLLYKHLHPLYKFIVGLKESGKESTPEEIEYVKQMIEEMPMDGTLVLPERYDVEVVGAQGEAIDASWALRYFEQRVFTGLGVPETVFGRASTSNKATADNLTIEMHDRVKAFQRSIATQINFEIIKELLLEGGFDPLVRPEDNVEFFFKEIAYDERIKQENHIIQKFTNNTITFEEMRMEMGNEPVVDENRLYFRMISIPSALEGSSKNNDKDGTVDNKDQPANQHGKKLSPKRTTAMRVIHEAHEQLPYSANLRKTIEGLRNDVMDAIDKELTDQIPMYITMAKDQAVAKTKKAVGLAFANGMSQAQKDCNVQREPKVSAAFLRQIEFNCIQDLERFFIDLERLLRNAVTAENKTDQKLKASAAFSSLAHRLDFCEHTQPFAAYNQGYAAASQALDRTELIVEVNENTCERCKKKAESTINIKRGQDLAKLVPPWHPNCLCRVKIRS